MVSKWPYNAEHAMVSRYKRQLYYMGVKHVLYEKGLWILN